MALFDKFVEFEKKATPSPWTRETRDRDNACFLGLLVPEDEDFVAAARSLAPLLIELVQELREAVRLDSDLPIYVTTALDKLERL